MGQFDATCAAGHPGNGVISQILREQCASNLEMNEREINNGIKEAAKNAGALGQLLNGSEKRGSLVELQVEKTRLMAAGKPTDEVNAKIKAVIGQTL